jgi:hypothetical protein
MLREVFGAGISKIVSEWQISDLVAVSNSNTLFRCTFDNGSKNGILKIERVVNTNPLYSILMHLHFAQNGLALLLHSYDIFPIRSKVQTNGLALVKLMVFPETGMLSDDLNEKTINLNQLTVSVHEYLSTLCKTFNRPGTFDPSDYAWCWNTADEFSMYLMETGGAEKGMGCTKQDLQQLKSNFTAKILELNKESFVKMLSKTHGLQEGIASRGKLTLSQQNMMVQENLNSFPEPLQEISYVH